MCGIAVVATSRGKRPPWSRAHVERMRDALAHRGPDGAGLWESPAGHITLAHRRLAVLDPTDAGAQPMTWPHDAPPRWVLSYNGELYNDADLRAALERLGVRLRTRCDTETVVAALDAWGSGALARFRGMFALAAYDVARDRLLLARDPLGIKPAYWFRAADGSIAVASEPAALFHLPGISPAPNWRMVSAYISTIRTTLGGDTLFQGIHAVQPGTVVEFDLRAPEPAISTRAWWHSDPEGADLDAPALRAAVEDSVRAHLRADVPTCCLLSGGLDSTIIAAAARRDTGALRTYAAGAAPEDDDDPANADLIFAARAAAALRTRHAEAVLTRDGFLESWPAMVRSMGVPLSTPNEVAIHAIARTLRADGCIVTMSGEGADELFGGYDAPLGRVVEFRQRAAREGWRVTAEEAAMMELIAGSWAGPGIKDRVVTPECWRAVDADAWLHAVYTAHMREAIAEAGTDGLGAHLRMHRRINLTGLLQRLDSATMLASVEGRTPFADARIAAIAESLPVMRKITLGEPTDGAGGVATATRTKIALREAFADVVPGFVLDRPKRSFPVPFRAWIEPIVRRAAHADLVREVYPASVLAEVVGAPDAMWHIAWPMANLGLWAERWWGREAVPHDRP